MPNADDLVMCLGDLNGLFGWHNDVLDAAHQEYDVGQRN